MMRPSAGDLTTTSFAQAVVCYQQPYQSHWSEWLLISVQEWHMTYHHLIQSNPAIMMGKPIITGTRITVESILTKLAAGETDEQLLAAHPRLTKEAIQAALAFAADVLRADIVYPVADKAA